MQDYGRVALYFVPEPGPLADFGSSWLGWDIATGQPCPHPDSADLPVPVETLTRVPRKYGMHGTLKPPFRLAPGYRAEDVEETARLICASIAPVPLGRLRPARIGKFLALVPEGPTPELAALAEQLVRGLDQFRAPPSPEELARRRKQRLSPRQEELLMQWGYPYVMEEFRFHCTLTGPLDAEIAGPVLDWIDSRIASIVIQPVIARYVSFVGERADGRFEEISKVPLTG
ncbi:DUF1045 domain-containing protein [Pseudooceanicola sp. C21-150M6]|uniref:DUF1045 domain-containing protein n=1 Tax=Pseudooceanicola sp. C21-150M6 TaxID=3434355 RepID=UPI003D7FED5A